MGGFFVTACLNSILFPLTSDCQECFYRNTFRLGRDDFPALKPLFIHQFLESLEFLVIVLGPRQRERLAGWGRWTRRRERRRCQWLHWVGVVALKGLRLFFLDRINRILQDFFKGFLQTVMKETKVKGVRPWAIGYWLRLWAMVYQP